jgi:geranylgeranyl diphosphate synthase type I
MLPTAFERYRDEIDATLRSALAGHTSPLYDMLRYHLGWMDEHGNPCAEPGGKALRPTLCLLACDAASGSHSQALPAAAAVELAHNFSLIHDDIQDDDRERRHRPTVWSVWGKAQAINAGTAMRVLASLTALGLVGQGVPVVKQLRALRLLDESCLRLIEGQYLDISFERRLDVGVADYMAMIDLKTAYLIACSLELGAMLGSDDGRLVGAFQECGRRLGLAFQIRDDYLGIWGDGAATGKPVGADIRRRKKTLPVVYALDQARGQAAAELARIYGQEQVEDADVATVLDILAGLRAESWVQGMAEEYGDKALAALEDLTLTDWARQSLNEVAAFLIRREC